MDFHHEFDALRDCCQEMMVKVHGALEQAQRGSRGTRNDSRDRSLKDGHQWKETVLGMWSYFKERPLTMEVSDNSWVSFSASA